MVEHARGGRVTVNGREGTFTIDLHRTTFDEQLVVNLDRDARTVVFQPLTGPSFSNSLQAEVNIQPWERFEVRAAYRYLDVQQTIDGRLRGILERCLAKDPKKRYRSLRALEAALVDYARLDQAPADRSWLLWMLAAAGVVILGGLGWLLKDRILHNLGF